MPSGPNRLPTSPLPAKLAASTRLSGQGWPVSAKRTGSWKGAPVDVIMALGTIAGCRGWKRGEAEIPHSAERARANFPSESR